MVMLLRSGSTGWLSMACPPDVAFQSLAREFSSSESIDPMLDWMSPIVTFRSDMS